MKIARNISKAFTSALLFSSLLLSCATTAGVKTDGKDVSPPPPPPPPPPPTEQAAPKSTDLSVEGQDIMALEVFTEILEMTADAHREDILPDMQIRYFEIIKDYPDSQYAEQSYWRLIRLYLYEHNPPRLQETEQLYSDFKKKYPKSYIKNAIEDTIARFLYRVKLWAKLRDFTRPSIKRYIKTGSINGPFFLFLYAEALMHLGDTVEAKKGFKLVIDRFPSTTETRISKKRLKELETIKKE